MSFWEIYTEHNTTYVCCCCCCCLLFVVFVAVAASRPDTKFAVLDHVPSAHAVVLPIKVRF